MANIAHTRRIRYVCEVAFDNFFIKEFYDDDDDDHRSQLHCRVERACFVAVRQNLIAAINSSIRLFHAMLCVASCHRPARLLYSRRSFHCRSPPVMSIVSVSRQRQRIVTEIISQSFHRQDWLRIYRHRTAMHRDTRRIIIQEGLAVASIARDVV